MTLKLYNSLTRQKEIFTPEDANNVRMYVCGPTVYARPHLGNARSVVVYDVLFRLLRHLYGESHVTYARNITDVDDKINAAAIERGISIQELTKEVTAQFHEDMDALNCLRPTLEPTATGHIGEIISMIEKLIENGNAYIAEGHVLFDVVSSPLAGERASKASRGGQNPTLFPPTETANAISAPPQGGSWHYGMLSGRKTEEQEAGARIAVESYKKNPGDFVLWKPAKESDDASSKFDSPWGVGRPGWHIECSAMSTKHLGQTFDIHGGGADLMFPHHENEIAQSRCAYPQSDFARVWVHNGFLTVNGEKMSKSLGNFVTVYEEVLRGIWGELLRFVLLSSHYRKPFDYNNKIISDSRLFLMNVYNVAVINRDVREATKNNAHKTEKLPEEFVSALTDDLNISIAFRVMIELSKEFNRSKKLQVGLTLVKCAEFLGFLEKLPPQVGWVEPADKQMLEGVGDAMSRNAGDKYIEDVIAARAEAKKAKNWAEADRIRDELKAQGIILEDRPDGTTDWRRA